MIHHVEDSHRVTCDRCGAWREEPYVEALADLGWEFHPEVENHHHCPVCVEQLATPQSEAPLWPSQY